MQLEFLSQQKARLSGLNIRSELHGDSHVTAVDVDLQMKLPNNALAYFHPTLKHALYEKDETAQQELLDDANHLTRLRFPQMKNAIAWDWSGIGYTFTVFVGVSGKENVVVGDARVVKPKIDPQDGGTVVLNVQIQCKPSPAELGRLSALLGSDIDFILVPPEATADDVNADTKPLFDESKMSGGITGDDQLAQAEAGLAEAIE